MFCAGMMSVKGITWFLKDFIYIPFHWMFRSCLFLSCWEFLKEEGLFSSVGILI